MNASGTVLNATVTNGCFIAPIATQANSTSTFFNLLMYGSDNQIVQTSNLKMDANGLFSAGSITSSITSEVSQLRLLSAYNANKYGVLLRYDGYDFYMLRTNANDPYGGWSNDPSGSIDRPFRWSLETGKLTFGAGITCSVSSSLENSASFPALSLTNISGFNTNSIDFYPHINVGSFNSIVESGDFAIINKDRNNPLAGISLGVWGGNAGLRIAPNEIKINGYVGIGKSTVRGMLEVAGSIVADGEIISTNANAFRCAYGNYGTFFRNDGGSLYLMLTNSGNPYGDWNGYRPFVVSLANGNVSLCANSGSNVGIGTYSPVCPLHVTTGVNLVSTGGIFTIVQYVGTAFFSGGGGGQNNTGIYSENWIATASGLMASAFTKSSDFRIKKNIKTCTKLLDSIDKLHVVSYDYIDQTKNSVDAGIIAQELASIYPNSVNANSETLPNIYAFATHTKLENDMIRINVNYTKSVDIYEGSSVKLKIQHDEKTNFVTYEDTIVNLTPNSFDIKAWTNYKASDEIFVYGTKVQNFLSIDAMQFGAIAVGAVKELYQHVKVLQSPDITIGNRTDPTVGSFKITYDADKSTLVMGSSINGFVNKQFLIHQSAPANSLSITADGTVYNNGTLVSSDRRIKTDIEPISDEECLLKINRLNVVKYNYTNPYLNGANKVIGFIAQEVREAIPEAVDITTKNIYWSNTFNFTVGQSNTVVDSTYTSLSDKDGKTYTITNGVVYDDSNTAVFYFKDNLLVSVHSTPTRDEDGKLLYSISKTYDLSKDDTYVLHTHSIYKQTDVMISVTTVDVIVGNIVRFVYNSKKYEGIVMTIDSGVGAGASTLKVVTSDILVNGTLQTYEKVIQDFHMLSKEKIFALTVGAIQDLTTANTALKSQVGSLQSQVGSLQSQVGSLQSQLSTLMSWAKGQGFTDASA
jgi:chaperonin cofactor prefoldin